MLGGFISFWVEGPGGMGWGSMGRGFCCGWWHEEIGMDMIAREDGGRLYYVSLAVVS
jgi:hypothetical protein